MPNDDNLKTPTNIINNLTLEQILNLLPGNIYWLDNNHVYHGCNLRMAKLMGFNAAADIIGKTNVDLLCAENQAQIDETNRHIMASGKAKLLEETAIYEDGTKGYYLSHKVPLKDEKNSVIGLLGMSIDITEQKQEINHLKQRVEQAKVTLESIIAAMPGHVYWKNKNGVYLGCNDRQAHNLGFAKGDDIVGKTDFDLPWPENLAQSYRENDLHVMKTGQTKVVEETALMENKKVMVLSQKAPLKNHNGEIIGIIGISVNIDQLKAAAEKSERLKAEFIHNMEHDIRTPLSGMYQIAKSLAEEEGDIRKQTLLDSIANCAKELLNYNNDVIDFSNMTSGALPIIEKKFTIRKLLDEVLNMETLPAKVKQLELEIICDETVPQVIIGDRYRLQRILINLLSNAIKFTQQGCVRLKIKLVRQIDPRSAILSFIVEDSGIGISTDKLDLIYEKFSRFVSAENRSQGGLGLGLSVIKQFVGELDGDIDVVSVPEKGTTFTCTFTFKLPLLDDFTD